MEIKKIIYGILMSVIFCSSHVAAEKNEELFEDVIETKIANELEMDEKAFEDLIAQVNDEVSKLLVEDGQQPKSHKKLIAGIVTTALITTGILFGGRYVSKDARFKGEDGKFDKTKFNAYITEIAVSVKDNIKKLKFWGNCESEIPEEVKEDPESKTVATEQEDETLVLEDKEPYDEEQLESDSEGYESAQEGAYRSEDALDLYSEDDSLDAYGYEQDGEGENPVFAVEEIVVKSEVDHAEAAELLVSDESVQGSEFTSDTDSSDYKVESDTE